MPTEIESSLLKRLEAMGDARPNNRWHQEGFSYVQTYNLTPDDTTELIRIARLWLEREDWPDDDTVFCSVHAWRALGQLDPAVAVAPLLSMMDGLDEREDDWYLSEFPVVFGMAGADALPKLIGYLRDDGHGQFSRMAAANGLSEAARRFPDLRREVISALLAILQRHDHNLKSLNASLIGDLLDLKATEAAEAIERAMDADCVEESYCGNWAAVRQELGVEGIGLINEAKANRSIHSWSAMLGDGPVDMSDLLPTHYGNRTERRTDRKRERQQRKQKRKQRKRRR